MEVIFVISAILILFILTKGILKNELEYRINRIIRKMEDK